jgi:hypothetical protein
MSGSPAPPATPTAAPTAGVFKGTATFSGAPAQTIPAIVLTGSDGHSLWMTGDGRVWSGDVPQTGTRFEGTFDGHMSDGAHFPDGTSHGAWSMTVEHRATGMTGQFHGSGDTGSFAMDLSPMWDRPAALTEASGVYTRSTSAGYSMTLTLSSNGQLTGQDSYGCVFQGTVQAPDPAHNLYRLEAAVSSCGALDGTYNGMGTLLDADAMRDWMTAMHPLEHGGHSHGGSMGGEGMSGSSMMGGNTVPSGTRNLFLFCLANDGGAIMDAVAR